MQKKKFNLFITFLFIFLFTTPALSYVEVKVKPVEKISTSDPNIQEGNFAKFTVVEDVFYNSKLIIKKGTETQGVITYIEPNGFSGQNAKMTIEQFDIVDVSNKKRRLTGSIFKAGDSHDGVLEFLPTEWGRGGEVQIKPKKDCFKLFLKENL